MYNTNVQMLLFLKVELVNKRFLRTSKFPHHTCVSYILKHDWISTIGNL